jgi:Na+/proline symporter
MGLFSIILVFANLLFVSLGALLYIYAANFGLEIPSSSDQLYPTIALNHLPTAASIFFLIGLIAAAYSSADSALTALTTSFCVDFLNIRKRQDWDEQRKRSARRMVHVGFSVLLLLVILAFQLIADEAVINSLFKAAGYTYGPLLGLFSYGLFTSLRVREYVELGSYRIPALLLLCVLAPVVSFFVDQYSAELLNGFQFGFLILAFNGLLTFVGLLALSDYSESIEGEIME